MENQNKAIGVMDSGVGGLTVLKQLLITCPNENYIYFGDTKNLPYGEKNKEQLIKIVKEIFDFFKTQNVKAVVLACNTTSATAYDELKDNYDFKIYPLIQTVSKCVASDKDLKKVAVMATQATVGSKKYTKELLKNNPALDVFEQSCPLFVPIVEQKLDNYNEKEIFESYINPIKDFNPQKIILGCTHYPYLTNKLAKYIPQELFINPAPLFAQFIRNDLENNNLATTSSKGCVKYCSSSDPEGFRKNAQMFLNIDNIPELIEL